MASADSENRRQEAGGKRKRKRQSKYLQHSGKKSTISAGLQGFLITCVGGKERQSIREAISLLDQFCEIPETEGGPVIEGELSATSAPEKSDKNENSLNSTIAGSSLRVGHESDESLSATSGDSDRENTGWVKSKRLLESSSPRGSNKDPDYIPSDKQALDISRLMTRKTEEASQGLDELLEAELLELRDTKKARFIGYETGCNGVIFVRMHLAKSEWQRGPKELAEAIVRDAATSKKSRSRYCMRLLPVELTCYASAAEVQKVAEPLILRHFPKDAGQPSFKFAVICESRANTNLNRMEFINAVAKMVPEPHSVDLKKPDKTILVQIVKTACAIGVVEDFKELAKYNLRQLTSPSEVKGC